MLFSATLAPVASPKRIARSTAPRFSTGSTPGSARSITVACVLGAPPNAVDAPENILLTVESCACVSRPITTSQLTVSFSRSESRRHPAMPVGHGLICVRRAEHAGLFVIVGHQLKSDRAIPGAESAGNAHARNARQRTRHRVKVSQVHRHGVVALFAEPESDAGRNGARDHVALAKRALEIV